jgi:hypothetical protein
MENDEPLKPKYPGCPIGWEPPTAPVFKYSTAVLPVNALLIDASYDPGTVYKEVRAFFAEPTPDIDEEGEEENNRQWILKGEKGSFCVVMEYGEGYFFCNLTVLREQYFEAKELLRNLSDKVDNQ